MDEVTFLVTTLQNEWSTYVSKGLTSHQVTPTIIDIRTLAKNKGRRGLAYDYGSGSYFLYSIR